MRVMRKPIVIVALLIALVATNVLGAKRPDDATTYAWTVMPPLGLRVPVVLDTLFQNYSLRFVPTEVSHAYATTGNYGGPGETLLFSEWQQTSQFFFADAIRHYLPSLREQRFFNSRIPLSIVGYSASGGREDEQSRLHGIFSGNFNPRTQFGAHFDYLYSKGSYDYQALKHMNWGISGSYMGDRYEFQGFFNHWNQLEKENGGITDDLYITDPAQLQGGQSSIQPKAIPTNLVGAFNRVKGGQLYLNNAYKLGFWREEEVDDSTTNRYFVPVTRLAWTLDYQTGNHKFLDNSPADTEFWENTYFDANGSLDRTTYWSLANTFGVELMEDFNKFGHFGLSAFVTHEMRSFKLPVYEPQLDDDGNPVVNPDLAPLPCDVRGSKRENLVYIGGQITKQRSNLLNYDATVRFGLVGDVAGDLDVNGNIATRFKLFGDSLVVGASARFSNTEVPYLIKNYISNHFAWSSDFGKERRLKVAGQLKLKRTGTNLSAGVENIQNYVYFNERCLPVQKGGSVQVVYATLGQDFNFGPVTWANSVTWQTSSDESAIPLPKLSLYSNLSVQFRIAKVLRVQLGLDCSYFTEYKSIDYQPATMVFYNQSGIKCGNYPFVNAFINMKLSRVRFYVMMSHVNQGLTGDNYFSMPHYPLNPRRFQMGLCVDFQN